MSKIQSIRGMNDLLPIDSSHWQFIEKKLTSICQSYAYSEIRPPILEKTELFKRAIGEVTDVVEKEMYSFDDRKGDSLTMRPEGTAGCARAVIQNGLLDRPQRLYYRGPMFRYERPQKGRLRQFHQFGIEAFGIQGALIEAEILGLTADLWTQLNIADQLELQINSLGTAASRAKHKVALTEYLTDHFDQLDEDSKRRLTTNPLRVLDSKNPDLATIIEQAPKPVDYLESASIEHFEQLQQYLTELGVSFVINYNLVRGLDYYNDTVFEWVTEALGSQGTLCAGGRYDGLVEQIGGQPTAAFGFGMGLERLILLIEDIAPELFQQLNQLDAYLVYEEQTSPYALKLAQQVRQQLPSFKMQLHQGGGSLKSQFKKANKSGATYALVVGEQELKDGKVTVKHLREDVPQQLLSIEELRKHLRSN